MSGPLPGWLGNLARLESLHLDTNGLSGPIPDELQDLVRLKWLALGWNELSGPVPGWLGSLVQLESLGLGGNALSGPIPDELQELVNLESLSLGWNELSGPVPDWLGNLVRLEVLDLRDNGLRGPIPDELQELVNLESLSLGYNELSGPVPDWLGNLVRLESLGLSESGLSGPIPIELGGLTNLRWLELVQTNLTGAIPAELGNLANLEWLDLSYNALTGPIPAELGNLLGVEWLDLSNNDLAGPIPAELGNLMNLERLDLSHAWGLSGALPAGLEQSALEELDVFVTRTCAPPAWREWLATIDFYGPLCEAETDGRIDVAVVYTPAALEAAGGAAAIEASIDLMIAETNEAYAASGLRQRLALVGRSEVPYAETWGGQDVYRLRDPSDGHLDEAHVLRDAVGPTSCTSSSATPGTTCAASPRASRVSSAHPDGVWRADLRARARAQHGAATRPVSGRRVRGERVFAPRVRLREPGGVRRGRPGVGPLDHDHVLRAALPPGRRHVLGVAPLLESAPALRRRPAGHPLRYGVGPDRSLGRGGRPRSDGARGGDVAGPPRRRRQPAAGGGGNAAGPDIGVGGGHAGRGPVAGLRGP